MAFDATRFLTAQNDGTYDAALAELRAGRKTSHWMWFVFPQVAGLGRSATAQHYALAGRDEARAYLAHPVLGPRLVEASRAVLDSGAPDAQTLLGGIDAMKLRSSMTLFEAAAGGGAAAPAGAEAPAAPGAEDPAAQVGEDRSAWAVFGEVLDRYYAGRRDEETLRRL